MSEPIPVPKKSFPTDEEVEQVLEAVIKRFERMFEDHKHSYGWSHKTLNVK